MNQRTTLDNQNCSIAKTLNIIGEWWTLLILRDLFYDINRFNMIQEHLGISKKVLTNRLDTLLKHEIVRKKQYQSNPPRHEYKMTNKGKDLFPIIVSLMKWGNDWIFNGENVPIRLLDSKSMKSITPTLVDENSGKAIKYGNVRTMWGSDEFKEDWMKISEYKNRQNAS